MRVCLLMPDHVHGVMAFGRDRSIKQIVSSWKGFLAKTCGIAWQRDFFEHRLRNDENEVAKVHYVRMNPVRAGLVARPEDWPYVWPR